MTTVKRGSKFNVVQTFTEYIGLKTDSEKLATRAKTLNSRIKDWFPTARGTYQNENGSLFFDFDETVTVAGQDYKGVENRRRVSTVFNEGKAEVLLTAKGEAVRKQALSTYVDQEKLAVLVQKGLISEEELDSLFEEKETFSLYPVKGEVL